jgi:hypothetical protein
MIKYQSYGSYVADRKNLPCQRDVRMEEPPLLVDKKCLQYILTMFLDLGLTPHEMSKTSGFPMAVIVLGLKQLDAVDPMDRASGYRPTSGGDTAQHIRTFREELL